jgi:hypothetical protein
MERRTKQATWAKSQTRCKEEKDKEVESEGDEMRQWYFFEFFKLTD